jgi:hypothetical protein
MTLYRTVIWPEHTDPAVFVYHGRSVKEALDQAEQHHFASVVSVEYLHDDGSWRTVIYREDGHGRVVYPSAAVWPDMAWSGFVHGMGNPQQDAERG